MLSFTSATQLDPQLRGAVSLPWAWPDETRALASWLEKRLAEECSTATSYVLPLPESADVDALKADIKAGRGRLHIVDTTSTGWGDGTAPPAGLEKQSPGREFRLKAWASSAPT